jgi:hypothetical protein
LLPLENTKVYRWYRGFIQGKTRIVLDWVFAIWLIASAHVVPQWPGIFVCFLGASVRFWAGGFLRKDNRLAIGGPYAWIRNPLYFGRWLMAIGVALSIENWALAATLSIVFAVIYHYIILDEETKLERLFGAPYLAYKKAVPRFFPGFKPASHDEKRLVNSDETAWNFDWKLGWSKNKGYEAYLTFVGLIGGVYLISKAWEFYAS